MRSRRACLPAAVVVAGSLLSAAAVTGVAVPQAQASPYLRAAGPVGDLLYQQGFGGSEVPSSDWISGGSGGQPCLTAGDGSGAIGSCRNGDKDAAGKGVLRLTANQQNQTGYVLYTHPLKADRGLNIAFDMYQYNTTTKGGADGIAFILVNGTSAPKKAWTGDTWASGSTSGATSPTRRSSAPARARTAGCPTRSWSAAPSQPAIRTSP
jgi:hypothetical protein